MPDASSYLSTLLGQSGATNINSAQTPFPLVLGNPATAPATPPTAPVAEPTAPTTTGAPTGTQGPAQGQAQGQGQVQTATAGTQPAALGASTQSNPYALAQVMSAMQNQIAQNNQLVAARNLVFKQLYDVPLTDADKAQLQQQSPALAAALASGDRNLIDFNLRLLNDQVAGRTNTLDQSIQTLTTGYNTAQQQLETQKQNALSVVQSFVTQYGDQAGAMLLKLGGPGFIAQLQSEGIDVSGLNAPTINQQRYSAQYGFTTANNVGGYDLSSYASDPAYSSKVASIASTIGPVTDAASAQAAIQQTAPGSPITGDMVMQAASQYGVDPTVLMSVMQADTQMGTDGSFGSRVNNYGDVGVNDTLAAKINAGTATPAEVAGVTMTPQGGVDAVAKWLSEHPAATSSVDTVAQGVIAGTIPPPPMSSRPTQYMLQLEAALQNKGYDLTTATEDWTATQKWLSTANSAQQLRLRQAINFADDSLNVIQQMNQAWQGSGFPLFNRASLLTAEQGVNNAPLPKPLTITVPSPDGSSVSTTIQDKQGLANLLNAQISDLTSEMGTVYKGGYSSTDDSLALAAKNLSADWSFSTLQSAIQLAQTNLQIRKNSIDTTQPITATGSNPYVPSGTSGPSGPSGASGGSYQDYLNAIQ